MSRRTNDQCATCTHNDGTKCAELSPSFFNGKKCNAYEEKYTLRVRILHSSRNAKLPVFYSDMERV